MVSKYGDKPCQKTRKIIPVPFRQPSTVFQPTGAAGEADHVEPSSVPSSLTCNHQPWPQLGVASRTRSFQMAFSCGDGYAHRWACHLMMMVVVVHGVEGVA